MLIKSVAALRHGAHQGVRVRSPPGTTSYTTGLMTTMDVRYIINMYRKGNEKKGVSTMMRTVMVMFYKYFKYSIIYVLHSALRCPDMA